MKKLRQRVLSLCLCAAAVLGLAVPALAYQTPDFTDLSEDHWAYFEVMKMADAGVIAGTGDGQFSPDRTVSAAQFLTLVGRIVFPEIKSEGADWSGPYVTAARENGLLEGAGVDAGHVGSDISRYDMAVILRNAARLLDLHPGMASEDDIPDYGDIPAQYQEAVLAVCGMGLIYGDENGRFNGSNTLTRAETAVVIERLWTGKHDLLVYEPDPVSAVPEGFISMAEATASFEGKYQFMFWETQLSVLTTDEEAPYCVAQWDVKDTDRIVRYDWTYYVNKDLMEQSIQAGEAKRQADGT